MFQLSNGQMGIPCIPRRDIFNGASVKLGNVEENYKTKPFFPQIVKQKKKKLQYRQVDAYMLVER